MYQEPIFLKPVFKERIWGGKKLRDQFNYEISTELTGECWGISAHKEGANDILNGPLKGKTLNEAWQSHRELFSNLPGEEFPLLTKIIDASDDLSVQVHPDDRYANEVEKYPYGKTECWYIIDCEDNAEILYGHHASTKEEFQLYVSEGSWDKLFRRVKAKPGDFFYIPSGTIHAIGKGIVILETQQNSDITYRVYDYNRRDHEGKLRTLHIDKSFDVVTAPHRDIIYKPIIKEEEGYVSKQLIEDGYFTVYHFQLKGRSHHINNGWFYLMSVLDGEGSVITSEGDFPFYKGNHFIIPATLGEYEIRGASNIIVSHPTFANKMER